MGRKRKNTKFKKFLIRYSIVLAILMLIFCGYVIHSLLDYESLQVENYLSSVIDDVIKAGEKEKISKYIDVSKIQLSEYENSKSVDKGISELLKNSKITYKLNMDSTDLNNPLYDVYVNDDVLLNIKLNGEKKKVELGILTVQDWKLEKISLAKTEGIYECIIEAPNEYSIYVNDKKVSESYKVESETNDEFTELSKYTDLPYIEKYKISNLIKEPKVEIKDEKGKNAEYVKNNNEFKIELKSETIQDEKEALKKLKGDIDVLKIAKDWSLFLSNDLTGTQHGFSTISKYLIKDSYMWNYAYKWATNVDITFISSHRLTDTPFTNMKVDNFNIYSENAFSCDAYLEKNMIINRGNGNKLTDVMNEKMYFAYYDGSWKLVNMQSIKK